jgi:hypothetical protein
LRDLTNRQKTSYFEKKNNYKDHLIQRCRYWNLSLTYKKNKKTSLSQYLKKLRTKTFKIRKPEKEIKI